MKINFNIVNLEVEKLHSKAIELSTNNKPQKSIEELLDTSIALYESCGYSEAEFLKAKFQDLSN